MVRALPHWAPIAIALVVATALGYWAGTGCTLALKRAGWRKPDPADMIELATGENLYDTHHRLVHAQIWIEHGLAQRQHRSLGSS